MYNVETKRPAWDVYVELVAATYAAKSASPAEAADKAAQFADQLCLERARRSVIKKGQKK
jgi:hypothetical protein